MSEPNQETWMLVQRAHQLGRDDLATILAGGMGIPDIRIVTPEIAVGHQDPDAAVDDALASLIDEMLAESEALIVAGRIREAFGKLISDIENLIKNAAAGGRGLIALSLKVGSFRGQFAKIASQMGANGFTLEFTLSVPPALTVGFHFPASPSAGQGADLG